MVYVIFVAIMVIEAVIISYQSREIDDLSEKLFHAVCEIDPEAVLENNFDLRDWSFEDEI